MFPDRPPRRSRARWGSSSTTRRGRRRSAARARGASSTCQGLVLLALGSHAAAAPLGATLQPVLSQGVTWTSADRVEADPASAASSLLGSAAGMDHLGASHRATLGAENAARLEPLAKWTDGAPLVARRTMGRGEAWIVTLPFSVDASDLPLRAAFLALLDSWVRTAREHASPLRTDVATPWSLARRTSRRAARGAAPSVPRRKRGMAPPRLEPAGATRRHGRRPERAEDRRPSRKGARPQATRRRAGRRRRAARRGAIDASGVVAPALLALMAVGRTGLRLYAVGEGCPRRARSTLERGAPCFLECPASHRVSRAWLVACAPLVAARSRGGALWPRAELREPLKTKR